MLGDTQAEACVGDVVDMWPCQRLPVQVVRICTRCWVPLSVFSLAHTLTQGVASFYSSSCFTCGTQHQSGHLGTPDIGET